MISKSEEICIPALVLAGRINRGHSLEQAGKSVGCDATTYDNWELGKSLPRPKFHKKLSSYLGMSIERLREIYLEAKQDAREIKKEEN